MLPRGVQNSGQVKWAVKLAKVLGVDLRTRRRRCRSASSSMAGFANVLGWTLSLLMNAAKFRLTPLEAIKQATTSPS